MNTFKDSMKTINALGRKSEGKALSAEDVYLLAKEDYRSAYMSFGRNDPGDTKEFLLIPAEDGSACNLEPIFTQKDTHLPNFREVEFFAELAGVAKFFAACCQRKGLKEVFVTVFEGDDVSPARYIAPLTVAFADTGIGLAFKFVACSSGDWNPLARVETRTQYVFPVLDRN